MSRKSKKKGGSNKKDALWAEAKRKCRLNAETVRMAKQLGLNPKSLIKNIPGASQKWKAPVHIWIRELYAERRGRAPEEEEGLPAGIVGEPNFEDGPIVDWDALDPACDEWRSEVPPDQDRRGDALLENGDSDDLPF